MSRVASGWKKSAAFRRSTGDKVQMNILSTEYSDLAYDNIKKPTPTGNAFGGKIYPLVVGFQESAGLATLEDWMDNNYPVGLAIYAKHGRHFISLEDEEMQVVPGYGIDAREGNDIHRIETEIAGGNPNVIWKQNIAEGITFAAKEGSIILPISGVKWKVAADYSASGGTLIVRCKNFAGTTVATASTTINAIDRFSAEVETTADTWTIEIELDNGGAAAVTNISMRSDGNDEYIDY